VRFLYGTKLSAGLVFCLCSAASAWAGEAALVLAHCGPPTRDEIAAPANGAQSRTITYGDIALTFQPLHDDWAFSSVSEEKIPLTQAEAIKRLPCLGDALEEAAANPGYASNETGAASEGPAAQPTKTRNAIFLWVIGAILAGVIFFAIRPYANSVPIRQPSAKRPRAPKRRPSASGIPVRPRKPADPPTSSARRRAYLEDGVDLPANPEDSQRESDS
jgi:hypothetical protein